MKIEEEAIGHLRVRVEVWAQLLSLHPRVVRIQEMSRKWGSCSSGGIVTLAADLAAHPKRFQDVVIVHELLHLRVRNHGKLFRALMDAHVPHWRHWRMAADAVGPNAVQGVGLARRADAK